MRFALAMIAAFTLAQPALSAECSSGSQTVIKMGEWRALKDEKNGYPSLAYSVTNTLPKGIRMIDANVGVYDTFGQEIDRFFLVPENLELAAGATTELLSPGPGLGAERILTIDRNAMEAIFCTRAVVYDDGTKETF